MSTLGHSVEVAIAAAAKSLPWTLPIITIVVLLALTIDDHV
ncbi:MAG: hypothetical protein ACRCYU_23380 [Nocardioides sp.]